MILFQRKSITTVVLYSLLSKTYIMSALLKVSMSVYNVRDDVVETHVKLC